MSKANLATMTPLNVISHPRFWSSNPGLLAAAALSLAGAAALWSATTGFSSETDSSNRFLDQFAFLIYLLVFWGIAVGARSLARIQVEHAVAEQVNALASKSLRGVESRQRDRPELHRLGAEILPNNPSPDISMIRLIQQIIQEARDRKFHPVYLLMQPYREESFGGLFKLQTIQKTALQLGILGTFVGLIMALSKLSGSTESASLDFSSLIPLFHSLNISFGTSMAGIAVSVILGLLVMTVRRKQEAYFQAMEDATVSMSALTRKAINRDELLVELSQVQTAINQLGERILRQSEDIESQTSAIEQGLNQLASAKGQFHGFLTALSEEQRSFLDEIRQLHEKLAPGAISDQLEARLAKSADRLSTSLSDAVKETLREMAELKPPFLSLKEALDKVRSDFAAESSLFREATESMRETRSEIYSTLERTIQKQEDLIAELKERSSDAEAEWLGRIIEPVTGLLSTHHGELLRRLDSLNGQFSLNADQAGRLNGDGLKAPLMRLIEESRNVHKEIYLARREMARNQFTGGSNWGSSPRRSSLRSRLARLSGRVFNFFRSH